MGSRGSSRSRSSDSTTSMIWWQLTEQYLAVHFRLSNPMAPFWSKGNFAHHFISARFQKCFYIPNFGTVADVKSLGPSATVLKLERQIFRSIANGPKVWDVGTKMAILANHKITRWPFLSQCTKLRDHPQRLWKFNVPTSGQLPTAPKICRPNFGTVTDGPEVWDVKTFLKPCW